MPGCGIRKDMDKDIYCIPMEEAIGIFQEGCENFGLSLDSFIKQEKIKYLQDHIE